MLSRMKIPKFYLHWLTKSRLPFRTLALFVRLANYSPKHSARQAATSLTHGKFCNHKAKQLVIKKSVLQFNHLRNLLKVNTSNKLLKKTRLLSRPPRLLFQYACADR